MKCLRLQSVIMQHFKMLQVLHIHISCWRRGYHLAGHICGRKRRERQLGRAGSRGTAFHTASLRSFTHFSDEIFESIINLSGATMVTAVASHGWSQGLRLCLALMGSGPPMTLNRKTHFQKMGGWIIKENS